MSNTAHRPGGRPPALSLQVTACVLLTLSACALTFNPALDTGGDNAEYLTLGRALAHGHGYRMTAEPDAPTETKRWPGYPVFLAGTIWLTGENLGILKATSVICTVGAAVLAWLYLRRQQPAVWWIPAAAVALFVLNEDTLHYASSLYAEALFILLSLAALVLLERAAALTGPGRMLSALGSAFLCASAIYVRPHGLALVPAAFAFLVLRKQIRMAVAVPLIIAVALGPWAWRQSRATASGEHTYVAKTLATTEEDSRGVSEARKYADRITRNAAAHFLSMGQTILARPAHVGFVPPAPIAASEPASSQSLPAVEQQAAFSAGPARAGIDPGRISRYLLAAIVLMGAVVTWRGAGSAAHWYVIFTFALLLVTPWPRGRYLVPLLPFFAWFLVEAILWAGDRTGRWLGEARARTLAQAGVAAVCALALLLTAMAASQQTIVNLRNRGLPWWAPERYAHEGLDLANYMAAAAWLRDNTPGDAIVVARKPYLVYWVSGRVSRMVWAESVEGSWQGFQALTERGPVYVIEDAFGDRYDQRAQSRTWWAPALAEHSSEVQLVHETAPPPVRVWRMLSQGPAAVGQTVHARSRSGEDRIAERDEMAVP